MGHFPHYSFFRSIFAGALMLRGRVGFILIAIGTERGYNQSSASASGPSQATARAIRVMIKGGCWIFFVGITG
jgi:hypothetical protein